MKLHIRQYTIPVFIILILTVLVSVPAFAGPGNSCWGQASAVFAKMGMMGEHSSSFDTPRVGLANLARELYDAGVISEPTLAELGAFVADELDLQIDRCTNNPGAVIEAEETVASEFACWGQATKVFAQSGMMGMHASSFDNPRLGLRNLARSLAEIGVIPDDSMAALGAFVASELGYEIDACE
jgi:hypothetical protein